MIRTLLSTQDGHLKEGLERSEWKQFLADDRNLLWLDLEKPTPEEVHCVAGEFSFHTLAVEDVLHRHQRPKIDRYDDFSFLVFYDIDYTEDGDVIDEHELDIFLGRNYLITVHDEVIEEIGEVADRYHRNLSQIERGVGVLLYSLLDTIVDHYFGVVDRVGERIEELDTCIFGQPDMEALEAIFGLRRELIQLRRVISPERDVALILARRDLPLVGEATTLYFQDVYDHVLRVTDLMDSYRDLLGSTLDSYLTLNSNRLAEASNNLNVVLKTLTSFSIILMSVTLIAGIYGMNFNPDASPWNMPELNAYFGYPGALLGMVLVGTGLAAFFKRRGWL